MMYSDPDVQDAFEAVCQTLQEENEGLDLNAEAPAWWFPEETEDAEAPEDDAEAAGSLTGGAVRRRPSLARMLKRGRGYSGGRSMLATLRQYAGKYGPKLALAAARALLPGGAGISGGRRRRSSSRKRGGSRKKSTKKRSRSRGGSRKKSMKRRSRSRGRGLTGGATHASKVGRMMRSHRGMTLGEASRAVAQR